MQMNGIAIFPARLRVFVSTAAMTIAALAGAALPARALTYPAPADTIRGIVFDSLLHQPIPDATVQADAGGVATTTDKEGRFTLMASETIHHVTVFHDFLDRTGLGSLQADVTPQTSHVMMVLSTPSLATIWGKLCGGDAARKGTRWNCVRLGPGTRREDAPRGRDGARQLELQRARIDGCGERS